MMQIFTSASYDETLSIAQNLAGSLSQGSVVAFRGGLGAGKTAFTTGLVKGLGMDCDVSSPTYALVNEYRGNDKVLYHFDMYRVESWDDLHSTGFFDYLDGKAYLCIEWSENIDGALPEHTVYVNIEPDGESGRTIKVWRRGESN